MTENQSSRYTFSLEKFLCEMMETPPYKLTLENFKALVARLQLEDSFLQKHVLFRPDKKYGWKPVLLTPSVEILTCCWMPGQESGIHDRGNSLNVTRVIQGVCTAQIYEVLGQELLLSKEEEIHANQLTGVERQPQFHQLINKSTIEPLVTLHFYCPTRPQ